MLTSIALALHARSFSHPRTPRSQVRAVDRDLNLREVREVQAGEKRDVDHREIGSGGVGLLRQHIVEVPHAGERTLLLLLPPLLILVRLQRTEARRGVVEVGAHGVHHALLCAALHHVNDGPLLRAAARQRDALEGVVDVLGDRRALRDGRAVVELKHRHRGARILGGEIGRAVLSLHHVNVDELHFRGSPFFRKSDAHARGVRKAFEVVNPHRLFSLW